MEFYIQFENYTFEKLPKMCYTKKILNKKHQQMDHKFAELQ